jgi:hypothetical protein
MRQRLFGEPPLTARDCADWMGFTPAWVRGAITTGVTIATGKVVKLEAETLAINGRRTHRIHLDGFVTFLTAIGWKHLPSRQGYPAPARPQARATNGHDRA